MKRNYGKWALYSSLLSWGALIGGFVALMLLGFSSFGLWIAAHGGV